MTFIPNFRKRYIPPRNIGRKGYSPNEPPEGTSFAMHLITQGMLGVANNKCIEGFSNNLHYDSRWI